MDKKVASQAEKSVFPRQKLRFLWPKVYLKAKDIICNLKIIIRRLKIIICKAKINFWRGIAQFFRHIKLFSCLLQPEFRHHQHLLAFYLHFGKETVKAGTAAVDLRMQVAGEAVAWPPGGVMLPMSTA